MSETKNKILQSEVFRCECGDARHSFTLVRRSSQEDSSDLWAEFYLHNDKNIFKRIWAALRYVFGYKTQSSHWSCVNLSNDDINRLWVLVHQARVKNMNGEKTK